jgi:hypothetical protein
VRWPRRDGRAGRERTDLEEVDAAGGGVEVLLEGEDLVLEAAAEVLGGEELEAEGAVGYGEAEGEPDGVAHVLLGAARERGVRRRRGVLVIIWRHGPDPVAGADEEQEVVVVEEEGL